MNTQILLPVSKDMLPALSRKELYDLILGEQSLRLQLQTEVDKLKTQYKVLRDNVLEIEGQYVRLKEKVFSPSTEKSLEKEPKTPENKNAGKGKKKRTNFSKDLTKRYPNAPVVERTLTLETPPACKCCSDPMERASLSEVTEFLHIEPKKFTIVRQIREKYRCRSCQGSLVTTPAPKRIAPGSVYSDEMILDISLSKYLDLIPVERYASMAARTGFSGLPRNSLIKVTHQLAQFLSSTKERIKQEILASKVLWADETPHKMLEGSKIKNWYLWSFSCALASYFECHGSRSGDVAHTFLEASQAEVLLSDAFSGYGRAVDIANKARVSASRSIIIQAFCNAHARRKFKEAERNFPTQAEYYLRCYRIIYRLEALGQERGLLEKSRRRMRILFNFMKKKALSDLASVSEKSELAKAIKYFQNYFDGLTLFLNNLQVHIDNNAQERLLRSPVIGRKTWYGTHSIQGAETAATVTTIVESCKLVGVNPREYLKILVQEIHQGNPPFTPSEYKKKIS